MRKAVINPETGEVENVILARDGFEIPGKLLISAEQAGPGWTYQDGKFVPPAEPEKPTAKPYEPSEMEIRFKALEAKAGVTDSDRAAARQALVDAKGGRV